MDSRERKKRQVETASELHTIDVVKALANASDAAQKMKRPPSGNAAKSEQAVTTSFKRKTLPLILVGAALICALTYLLVSRLAR